MRKALWPTAAGHQIERDREIFNKIEGVIKKHGIKGQSGEWLHDVLDRGLADILESNLRLRRALRKIKNSNSIEYDDWWTARAALTGIDNDRK